MLWPAQLCVGYKFMPTDEEIVVHYLSKKVNGLDYYSKDIKEHDLYGNDEPWEIFKMFGGIQGQDLYFFTTLKRNSSGSRVIRKVGRNNGTWSGENNYTVYSSESNQPIAYCRRFRYENGELEHHAEWIMHEYSVLSSSSNAAKDLVLCRIRQNDRPKIKKAKKRLSCERGTTSSKRIKTNLRPVNTNQEAISSNNSELIKDLNDSEFAQSLVLDLGCLWESEENVINEDIRNTCGSGLRRDNDNEAVALASEEATQTDTTWNDFELPVEFCDADDEFFKQLFDESKWG